MIQINKPLDVIIKAAGKQKYSGGSLRFFTYLQTCDSPDGLLLYNLMTREFLLLDNVEAKSFRNIDTSNDSVRYLIENWFLVPTEFDDYLLYKQTDTVFRLLAVNDKSPLTTFVIYPTTDCNARCFYCFELACKRTNMTAETARDVADFILKKSCGKRVHIMWFGGEPLYNALAIDIISNRLNDAGLEFGAEMVSNGYLFDEALVKKACSEWKLKAIQITLDGTEQIYNKTKAYIYKDVSSPFIRVLDNIELLCNAGVKVKIRLNMDMYNYDDLKHLSTQLAERFSSYENCVVYVALLFENVGKCYTERTDEVKQILIKKQNEISEILNSYGMYRKSNLMIYRQVNQCMADNCKSTTILPDGSLGRCEHYTDGEYYGSIYNDAVDMSVIRKFRERSLKADKCRTCNLLTKCYTLKACPIAETHCDDIDKELKIDQVKKEMINSYDLFKKNKVKAQEEHEEETQFMS